METQDTSAAVSDRLDRIEHRLGGIEAALNRLLDLFGPPTLGSIASQAPRTSRGNTSVSGTDIAQIGVTVVDNAVGWNKSHEASQDRLDVNPDDPFSYTPLDSLRSEIRVLALKPSHDPLSPIVAELFTQSLDEDAYSATPTWRPYAALSYTWGAPIFNGSIILNGKPFPVTSSLESALRAMRLRSKDPTLVQTSSWPHDGSTPTCWWIDQICINQANVDERTAQVALMW
jgi:hypothetical protein